MTITREQMEWLYSVSSLDAAEALEALAEYRTPWEISESGYNEAFAAEDSDELEALDEEARRMFSNMLLDLAYEIRRGLIKGL